MTLNYCDHQKITQLINNDLLNIINTKNDALLYIFLVLIHKYGHVIDYDYILKQLLKLYRFNTIEKFCKLTYLNISINANIKLLKKFNINNKQLNKILNISQNLNSKYNIQKLTWDNFDSYLLILTNLKTIAKSFPYLTNNIVKLLNFNQTEDTNILYLYYNLLDIPVKIILKFTIYNSYNLSSKLFKFNYNYSFNILKSYEIKYPNLLNKSQFHFFDETIFNDAFNNKYLDNLQNKSIYHNMIDNEIHLRKLKKQRCK